MGQKGRTSSEAVTQLRAARKVGDVGVLVSIATDPSVKPPMRLSALKALRKTKDHRAVRPLTQLTTDSELTIRVESIKTIGELGGKDGTKALIAALESDHPKVSFVAAAALAERRDAAAAVPALIARLDSPNWRMRKTVALALSRIGRKEGLAALRAAAEAEPSRGKRKLLERYAEPSDKR